jgi:hypothetical protein
MRPGVGGMTRQLVLPFPPLRTSVGVEGWGDTVAFHVAGLHDLLAHSPEGHVPVTFFVGPAAYRIFALRRAAAALRLGLIRCDCHSCATPWDVTLITCDGMGTHARVSATVEGVVPDEGDR